MDMKDGPGMYQGSQVLGRPWRKTKGQWTVRRKTDFIQLFWHVGPSQSSPSCYPQVQEAEAERSRILGNPGLVGEREAKPRRGEGG